MARSEDEKFASPSRIRVFAIGIRANILKPHPTPYRSFHWQRCYDVREF
jgi:hypothetical protein